MANKVTINTDALNITWATNTQYRFEVDDNFIVEDGGSGEGLLADENFFTFTTNSTGPVLSSSIPANGSTGVTDNSQVVIIFDRKIRVNTGNIRLYKQDGTLLGTFSVTDDTKVTVGDDRLTVDLFGYLTFANETYYFTVDAGVVKDYDGFNSVAIVSNSAISYTTGGAAAITITSPATGATYVTNKTSLTITFDRKVVANTGSIDLYLAGSPDTLINSFDITNASLVTVNNYTVTVDLTGYIKSFKTYYFLIDSGAVKDYGGIEFLGVTDVNAIRYTTSLLLDDTFVLEDSSDYAEQGIPIGIGNFGRAMALTDDYLIVGAPWDSTSTSSSDYGGAVSIRNPSTGAETAFIVNPDGGGETVPNFTQFGAAIAISGTTAVIAAPYKDDSYQDSGKLYVYNLTNNSLSRSIANPNDYGTAWHDNFGSSVALSGTTAIVGAPGEDRVGAVEPIVLTVDSAGKFYTGVDGDGNDGTDWLPNISGQDPYPVRITGTLTGTGSISGYTSGNLYYTYGIEGTYPDYYFKLFADPANPGTTVTVTAGTLTGLTFTLGIPYRGKAYLYNTSNGNLLYTFTNPRSIVAGVPYTGNRFGCSTAINSNYIVIGSLGDSAGGVGINDGKVYVYETSTYGLVYTLSEPGSTDIGTSNTFGSSIALNGSKLIVGSYGNNKAYIFDLTTGSVALTLTGPANTPTSPTNTYDNRFGWSVGISAEYAIVGDPTYGTSALEAKGRFYVYDASNGTLIMTAENPNAYGTEASDWYGHAVVLSSNYLAVSAPAEDPTGNTNGGVVYLYKEEF